jgi:hypothetical protein
MTLSEDILQNGVCIPSPQTIRAHQPKANEGTGHQIHVPVSYTLGNPVVSRFLI